MCPVVDELSKVVLLAWACLELHCDCRRFSHHVRDMSCGTVAEHSLGLPLLVRRWQACIDACSSRTSP